MLAMVFVLFFFFFFWLFLRTSLPHELGFVYWRLTSAYILVVHNYRLITAYLFLRVNLEKIMYARWDFYVSSAQTRRVSALDKHQNWSVSALFSLNSRAKSKYAVINLIHTRRKQTFLSFIMWWLIHFSSLKVIQIVPTKYIYPFRK